MLAFFVSNTLRLILGKPKHLRGLFNYPYTEAFN